MEIKGKVHEVSPTTQVTDSLKKRELIVEYVENPQYPEYLKFEAIPGPLCFAGQYQSWR